MDLEPPVERRADALKHFERVPRIVGVLQARDGRIGRAHEFGELLLGEACPRAELIYFLGDLGVQLGVGERTKARLAFGGPRPSNPLHDRA